MKPTLFALQLCIVLSLAGCHRHPAAPEECRYIQRRNVDLEQHELGFTEPVLAERKAAAIEGSFITELARCRGVRVRDGALACVQKARSVEELSHRCLR
jgi:hypothetical protein